MSDGDQGFPQDPPGMLLSSHLSRRKFRVVGEGQGTQGEVQNSGYVGNFSPSPGRPKALIRDGHLIKTGSRSPQQETLRGYSKADQPFNLHFAFGENEAEREESELFKVSKEKQVNNSEETSKPKQNIGQKKKLTKPPVTLFPLCPEA